MIKNFKDQFTADVFEKGDKIAPNEELGRIYSKAHTWLQWIDEMKDPREINFSPARSLKDLGSGLFEFTHPEGWIITFHFQAEIVTDLQFRKRS